MKILKKVPIIGRMMDFLSTMVLIILLTAITGLILAFPVMWLWNFIFGNVLWINVFQAWALTVLTGILFGGKNTSK
jgi:hypothetical protein